MHLRHCHFVTGCSIFIITVSSSSNNELATSVGEGDRRNLGRGGEECLIGWNDSVFLRKTFLQRNLLAKWKWYYCSYSFCIFWSY